MSTRNVIKFRFDSELNSEISCKDHLSKDSNKNITVNKDHLSKDSNKNVIEDHNNLPKIRLSSDFSENSSPKLKQINTEEDSQEQDTLSPFHYHQNIHKILKAKIRKKETLLDKNEDINFSENSKPLEDIQIDLQHQISSNTLLDNDLSPKPDSTPVSQNKSQATWNQQSQNANTVNQTNKQSNHTTIYNATNKAMCTNMSRNSANISSESNSSFASFFNNDSFKFQDGSIIEGENENTFQIIQHNDNSIALEDGIIVGDVQVIVPKSISEGSIMIRLTSKQKYLPRKITNVTELVDI